MVDSTSMALIRLENGSNSKERLKTLVEENKARNKSAYTLQTK
jgi:hypothetical protein